MRDRRLQSVTGRRTEHEVRLLASKPVECAHSLDRLGRLDASPLYEVRAVQLEQFNCNLAHPTHTPHAAVLVKCEMFSRVIDAGINQQAILPGEFLRPGSNLRPILDYGELRTLVPGTLAARRVQVGPLVRQPPVMIG